MWAVSRMPHGNDDAVHNARTHSSRQRRSCLVRSIPESHRFQPRQGLLRAHSHAGSADLERFALVPRRVRSSLAIRPLQVIAYRAMRTQILITALLIFVFTQSVAFGQLTTPNDAGVAIGHIHLLS